jgi:phosphopantothenoylcysteine decarboxylase / phosphopantothenate---cysteine ligase
VPHVRIGRHADLVVVAPATADMLAKAAHGIADDLLTNTLLTARCPVVFAPAMHTEMWLHPATADNVATLRRRGALVIDPAVGRLTGADTGPGRLPDPELIFQACVRVLARPGSGLAGSGLDLAGRHVVISAGGTREHLDPVRFLGNRSSGRQGYALATTALARGAEVTLVSANVALPDPAGAKVVRVVSAADLRAAVLDAATGADAVVMAAAVADFRPATTQSTKIKKTAAEPEPVALVRNPDILAELARARRTTSSPDQVGPGDQRQVIVGFAAETGDADGDVLTHGRAKLAAKGCDLLVVNEVGADRGFEGPDNTAVILGSDGTEVEVPTGPKEALADVVWDHVARRWADGAR